MLHILIERILIISLYLVACYSCAYPTSNDNNCMIRPMLFLATSTMSITPDEQKEAYNE